MIANSLIVQLTTLAIAVAIVFTYIKPTFAEIGERQNQIATLRSEKSTVESVQGLLDQLAQKRNNVSDQDRRRLFTYLPDTLDEVRVLRDIDLMTKTPGLVLNVRSLQYQSGSNNNQVNNSSSENAEGELDLVRHSFSISMITSYSQLKTFLSILERNHYPLEVESMRVMATDGGFLDVEIELITYSKQ